MRNKPLVRSSQPSFASLVSPDRSMLPIEVPQLYDEINDVPNLRAAHLAPGPAGITITAGRIALRVMIRVATRFSSRRANAIPLARRRIARRCNWKFRQ